MKPTRKNQFTVAREELRQYEPNTVLFNDSDDGPTGWAEAAFHAALAGPIPWELQVVSPDAPVLRWPNPELDAVSLLAAIEYPPIAPVLACNRCRKPLTSKPHLLWVPGGQSAVELHLCSLCHDVLNDVYRSGPERLLVWR